MFGYFVYLSSPNQFGNKETTSKSTWALNSCPRLGRYMRQLRELSRRVLGAGGLEELLHDVLDAAVASVGADQGTLQLLEGESLRIVARRGHKAPFLKFFESAETVA